MAEGHVGGRGAATAFGGANRREAPVGTIKRFAPGGRAEGPAAFGGGTYGATLI